MSVMVSPSGRYVTLTAEEAAINGEAYELECLKLKYWATTLEGSVYAEAIGEPECSAEEAVAEARALAALIGGATIQLTVTVTTE